MIYYIMNENNEIIRDDFIYFEGALSNNNQKSSGKTSWE